MPNNKTIREEIALYFYNANYPEAYTQEEINKYEKEVDKIMNIFTSHTTQRLIQELQEIEDLVEVLGKKQDGEVVMKFSDGTEADVKLHSDMALGYNQALSDILSALKEKKSNLEKEI